MTISNQDFMKKKIREAIESEVSEMRESFLVFCGLYIDLEPEEMIEALFDGWEAKQDLLEEENDKGS